MGIKDAEKWFRSNILSEYLPIILVVLILLLGTSYFGEKEEKEEILDYANMPALTLSSAKFVDTNELLPPTQTRDEILGLSAKYTEEDQLREICEDFKACVEENEDDPWSKAYTRQVQEYGDLATRFLSIGDEISWTEDFDFDGDGEDELAVALCGLWGNHCPHRIIIVKDERIIARTE